MSGHESEIEFLEAKRLKWRRIGMISGLVALADPLVSLGTLGAAVQADSGLIRLVFLFATFSFLPLIIFGVIARGVAVQSRNQARLLRELGKTNG